MVFYENEIGFGKTLTCHPSLEKKFSAKYKFKNERVIQDENMITSQTPGTSLDFALMILKNLQGIEKTKAVIEEMKINVNISEITGTGTGFFSSLFSSSKTA